MVRQRFENNAAKMGGYRQILWKGLKYGARFDSGVFDFVLLLDGSDQ